MIDDLGERIVRFKRIEEVAERICKYLKRRKEKKQIVRFKLNSHFNDV